MVIIATFHLMGLCIEVITANTLYLLLKMFIQCIRTISHLKRRDWMYQFTSIKISKCPFLLIYVMLLFPYLFIHERMKKSIFGYLNDNNPHYFLTIAKDFNSWRNHCKARSTLVLKLIRISLLTQVCIFFLCFGCVMQFRW